MSLEYQDWLNNDQWPGENYEKQMGSDVSEIAAESGDLMSQFLTGRRYLEIEDFDNAFPWFKRAAARGHVGALFNLGTMYARGDGVERNHYQSVQCFTLAASKGDAGSLLGLSIAAQYGHGMEQNADEANKLLLTAVKKGYPPAIHNLAIQYLNGDGMPKDVDKAIELFKEAADKGFGSSQFILASIFYEDKTYVRRDMKKCLYWME